ncbi:MAG TPA: hypothetical protein VI542_14405 [Candidatus Tectomicrobia bacterium]
MAHPSSSPPDLGSRIITYPLQELTITHNFRKLQERFKGQIVDNKKGAADNTL